MTAAVIPAEDCYWVRLPASSRGWTRDRVLAGIEPWIPSAVDRLDLAWQVGSDGQLVVVAVEPERLDAALAATTAAWMATPDRILEHVAAPGVDATALNLLTGARTPAQLRRLERRVVAAVIAATVLAVVLLGVGVWRRSAHLEADARAIAAQGDTALTAVLPAALSGRDPDPLIRLDQAKRLTGALVRAADGTAGGTAALCTALLAAWPADLRTQVANLSVDGNRCTIAGTAASVADTQRLATALAAALQQQPGWRMLPLAVTGSAPATFTCTMVREGS